MPPLIYSGPDHSTSDRKGPSTTMGSAALNDAVRNIRDWAMTEGRRTRMPARVSELFRSLVFNDQVQQARLPKPPIALRDTITDSAPLDASTADAVASALKDWAIEQGASHLRIGSSR